jgi:SAM-dependent methyltransferase
LGVINNRLDEMGILFNLSEVKGSVMDRLKWSDFLQTLTDSIYISQYYACCGLGGPDRRKLPHARKGKEMWNERFSGDDYLFGTEPADFVMRHATRLAPAQSVLSVADGEGRNSVYLAGLGHRVTAMDGSEMGVAKAQRLAVERDVTVDFYVADIATWDWAATAYNAVLGVFIQFASPPMRADIFAGMKAALRPGGLLLLHGYTPEQLGYGTGGPRAIENFYTPELLSAAFADFEILHLKAYEAEISEGAGHKGRSALIDLVARKPD